MSPSLLPRPAGIDVSHYQGRIDWPTVAAHVSFAIVRYSDGRKLDTRFQENRAGVRGADVVHGAYQYFRASLPWREQAEAFVAAHGALEHGMLPPALDLETLDGCGGDAVLEGALAWLDHVEQALRVVPLLYTYPSFWSTLRRFATTEQLATFARVPLWIAHYEVPAPIVPMPWGRALMWQHSCTGRVEGIAGKVDLNWFLGSEEELRALAGVQGVGG